MSIEQKKMQHVVLRSALAENYEFIDYVTADKLVMFLHLIELRVVYFSSIFDGIPVISSSS